ncbi:hypothetical protein J6TS7_65620 [Paenibacillus dendritiformis]|nr:hypothetical protein J6TS7_65620 [Paenibacillus dendritiformis]
MFIPPMLLETSERAFTDESYILEPKFDGHRAILSSIGEARPTVWRGQK